MKIKEFDVILCIKKKTEQESFEVVQGDSKSNLVRIYLTDGLEPYNLAGASVEIVFRKADGTTVQQTEQTGVTIINAAKGQLQCILKTNTIACPGPVSAEVRVIDTETLLTSSWFDFYVRKSLINDETIESTDEFPILTELITETNGLVSRVEQIEKQVPETVVQRIDDLELNKLSKDGDSSDTAVTFEDYSVNTPPSPETALGNIKTGSKLSILFSNIKAFCKGAITIGRLANNLSTTAEGLALDARQGKALNDLIGEINSNLAWESWQTLTLLNDWAGTLQVRKNGLGIIQLKGGVTVGVKDFGTTIAQLPTGFNSSDFKNVEFFGATGDLIDGIAVTPDGNLVVYRPAASSLATGITGYIDQFYNVAP